jgi:7-cyano-7-deazaguanine synthase
MAKGKKAVVLLSGGLDSTTTLYYALDKGYHCQALIFDYGQRHRRELRSAVAVAKGVSVAYHVLRIKLPWKGSSLLDASHPLPHISHLSKIGSKIPSTYVPARNTIFLSFALSFAEASGAQAIFIGANAVDYSGYPDCRPDYYKAFQKVIEKGTKVRKIRIITPLIKLTKEEIIRLGRKLGAPLEKTWSCYAGGKEPCGVCDSCLLRQKGFAAASR